MSFLDFFDDAAEDKPPVNGAGRAHRFSPSTQAAPGAVAAPAMRHNDGLHRARHRLTRFAPRAQRLEGDGVTPQRPRERRDSRRRPMYRCRDEWSQYDALLRYSQTLMPNNDAAPLLGRVRQCPTSQMSTDIDAPAIVLAPSRRRNRAQHHAGWRAPARIIAAVAPVFPTPTPPPTQLPHLAQAPSRTRSCRNSCRRRSTADSLWLGRKHELGRTSCRLRRCH